MTLKTSFFILLILLTPWLYSQDIAYAREVVNKLGSNEFQGRGYVNDGDEKAANFIESEFQRLGVLPFKKDFHQKFKISVNAFPGKMELSINGKKLIPGIDYLIDPSSPEIQGSFEALQLEVDDLLDPMKLVKQLKNAEGKFIVLPNYDPKNYFREQQQQISEVIRFIQQHPDLKASGTILPTNNKLTWGVSALQHPRPTFTVLQKEDVAPIRSIEVNVDADYFKNYSTQNVIGILEGERTDSLIVFTAHYDHLGMMGSETIFPGANDNASGIAMLLNLAKYYNQNKPRFNTVFIAFGGEELGLLGSQHFVENPLFELSKIKFLINFDMAGTGDDGIQVVNGKVYQKEFDLLTKLNKEEDLVPRVKIRGEACNSDHCFFYMKGVPSYFIYALGGIQAYHDIYDRPETLPLTEFEDYLTLITLFINAL